MTAACDLLEAELALDRVDAELAVELPRHLRAFAAAHAAHTPAPPAPAILGRAATLRAIEMGRAHPLLHDRALALARLAYPIAIDDDPRVAAARAADPTWDALGQLAAARDASARARFGVGFLALVHQLHGVGDAPAAPGAPGAPAADAVAWPPRVEGWQVDATVAVDAAIDVHRDVDADVHRDVDADVHRDVDADADADADADVDAVWRLLAVRHGARGTLQLVHARPNVRARAFVVEPQRHVIVVVPPLGALARASGPTRFAILHELGHALVALLAPAGVPRVVDEAVASYVARGMEVAAAHAAGAPAAGARAAGAPAANALPAGWAHPLATAARHRRTQLARALDAIERGLAAIERGLATSTPATARPPTAPPPTARPPWALWHDPGAQAAYVAAEAIADRWWDELGPTPPAGALADAITRERARVDGATSL